MQALARPFDIEDVSQLENLTEVAGYLRGTPFSVETHEPGVIPSEVLTYLHQLQEQNGLASEPDMSNAVVDLLNRLWMEQKYQDPVYIHALHDWLRPLNYALSQTEYQAQQYGSGTTSAVYSFQQTQALPATGSMDLTTEQALQQAYADAAYVVKGTIHDANWNGFTNAAIEVFEKAFRGAGSLLQSGTTDAEGAYELSYYPATDPETGRFVDDVHLLVRIKDGEGTVLLEEAVYHATPVTWVKYAAGNTPYQTESVYTEVSEQLTAHLSGTLIAQIEESDQHQDATYLYNKTGIALSTILQLHFAERVALEYSPSIPASVLFAFFKQQLPSLLPSYLLPDEPSKWSTWSAELVDALKVAVPLMPAESQAQAFDVAVYNNLIPLADQQNKTAILQNLDTLRLHYAKTEPLIAGKLSLDHLLQDTTLDATKKEALTAAFATDQQLNEAVIQQWYEDGLLNEDERDQVQQAFQLASLGLFDSILIQKLRDNYDQEGYSAFVYQVSDFAKWTATDWEALGYPASAATGDFAQRAATLAPTVATIAAIQRAGGNGLEHLSTLESMVDTRQLLSLSQVPIDTYLQENNIELPAAAIDELKLLQRVEHLAPQPEVAPILLGANVHSAYQAHRMGKAGLTDLYSSAGFSDSLAQTYGTRTATTADQTLGTLTGLAAAYGILDGGGVTPASITPLPNLEELFGNNDFCGCAHCRSVYSPAAYLTDLLHWLESKPSKTTGTTALDVLLARRPDLAHILLNCKNANTPMPYIDLVNEVLEYAIEPTPSYERRNTTWRAAELKAKPEHRLDSVYEQLAKLPSDPNYRPYASYNGFNLWQAQVHLMLEQLGITSSQFVQLLNNGDWGDLEQAAATFELPSHEAIAITTPQADVNNVVNPNRNVKALLHDHQLSYEQLLMLFEGDFTNPGGVLSIEPEGSCDLDVLQIANMTAVELDRWWRFLRLWKYTDWTIWELDALIMYYQIGGGALTADALGNLAQFRRIQQRLKLSVGELLGFMGQLDTSDRQDKNGDTVPSFYESVFYHRLLDESQRSAFDKTNLTLDLALGTITPAQIAYIADALELTSSQVEALLTFPQPSQWSQALPQRVHQMTAPLEGLEALYAYAKWMKQWRLSVDELRTYLRLMMPLASPFQGLDGLETFLHHYDRFKDSGMSLEALRYALEGQEYADYRPSETQVYQWQVELYRQVGEAYDQAMISKQTEEAVLRSLLQQTGTFDTDPTEADNSEENISTLLEVIYQIQDGPFTGDWDATDRTNYLNNTLPTYFGYADTAAVQQLQTDITTHLHADPAVATLKVILHRHLHSMVVYHYLAELWDVSPEVIAYLLSDEHPTFGRAARNRLMENEPTNPQSTTHPQAAVPIGGTGYTPPSFAELYRHLLKYVFFVKNWQLTAEDLKQLEAATDSALPSLDIAILPRTAQSLPYAPINQVEEFLLTAQWVGFAHQQGIAVAELVKAILAFHGGGSSSDFLEAVAELTGWDEAVLTELEQHFQWTTADYTTHLGHWSAWRKRVALIHQLGVSTTEALGWLSLYDTSSTTYFDEQQIIAQQVNNAVREATTSEQQWLLIQQAVQDQIRLQKRNALVAYARNYDAQGHRVYRSTNDLYHLHLIDPQMSACQLTSRIKQAISAVQLYVQRCRLGLEQDTIQVTDSHGWPEWKWMQYYRVWEANRKVFLYPENWIEPSLRDNKSELFKQFEEEVLQQEVTQENVELALQNYLTRLNEIANLEVMSLARSHEGDGAYTHVLARTKEHPAVYYYRTIQDDAMAWTGWEKVPFDIQGEHPILQEYNGKIHLFWLQIIEKPEELVISHQGPVQNDNTNSAGVPSSSRNMPNHKTIQLAWSVLYDTGWSAQQLSKKKLIHPWPRPNYSLHLRPRRHQHDLWLDIYVSTSPEFNNTAFYNQFTDKYERMTVQPYEPERNPWHSSSFVFDGFVRQVKLFAIRGNYWIKEMVGLTITSDIYGLNPSAPLWIDAVEIHTDPLTGNNYRLYKTNRGDYANNDQIQWGNFLQLVSHFTVIANSNLYLSTQMSVHRVTGVNSILYSIDNGTGYLEIDFDVTLRRPNSGGFVSTERLKLSIAEWNNLFDDGDPATVVTRPETVVGQNTYVSTAQFSATYELTDMTSYQYVQQGYGAEGRQIEELLGKAEQQDPLPLHKGYVYHYNKLASPQLNPQTVFATLVPFSLDFQRRYQVVVPMEHTHFNASLGDHLTFQVDDHSFFFAKELAHKGYRLYHPLARPILTAMGSQGREGLYDRSLQFRTGKQLEQTYGVRQGLLDRSQEDMAFQLSDGYGLYNWEIFFHIPFLIATELSKNQRFEEAMAWFHCVFNPLGIDPTTGTPAPASDVSRYWITKPFYEHSQSDYWAQQIQNLLGGALSRATINAINQWKQNPFQPHMVARMRPVAYQKAIVMKYIDNLLAWGDQLFRRETLESINQAGLMYILAAELLGDHPQEMAHQGHTDQDYETLTVGAGLDAFSNQTVLENMAITSMDQMGGVIVPNESPRVTLYSLSNQTQYFCIPHNEKLQGYWDLVADRLFKIRHCMDIDGRVRQLPLFAPPIDPALLVNATANGIDLGSVLQDLATPKPYYKYRSLGRLASQFCSDVKSLGQSLLSALQAKDAEGMALLQSSNAIKLLDAVVAFKQLQIEEAKENIQSLERSKTAAAFRRDFYANRLYMNGAEIAAQILVGGSLALDATSIITRLLSGSLMPIPEVTTGTVGPLPMATTQVIDGSKIAGVLSTISTATSQSSGILGKTAGLVATQASYDRRQEEWDFQAELAERDIEQIEQQIIAAQLRVQLAEKDLQNHQIQIENSKSEQAYLQSKYTNQQLYSWMVGQLSTTYFQAYHLAFDMAKRAEKSLNYELALPTDTPQIVQHGYWDSLHKGLLAGDKLMLAINQMEDKYVRLNQRELELTKHISLHQWAPDALLQLKTNGKCELNIPEWWFDLDYPGHYLRRIKALTVSIPCIVGPNTNVNCKVTLSRHSVRRKSVVHGSGYADAQNLDARYELHHIATSSGQNDAGVFELNFNDERFLPFEGLGAVSTWTLELPEYAQFDYGTITDVVFHLRYTARDGGARLAAEAKTHLDAKLTDAASQEPTAILISAREAFPTAWHRFKEEQQALTLDVRQKHFPYFTSLLGAPTVIGGLLGVVKEADSALATLDLTLSATNLSSVAAQIALDAATHYGSYDLGTISEPGTSTWSLAAATPAEIDEIRDVYLLLVYHLPA